MPKRRKAQAKSQLGSLGYEEVARITGPIDAEKIAQILAARPTAEELEEAVAWAAGESDVMGELERPLTGTVARLYDILTAEEGLEDRS
jgi:hypothetical protein